MGPKTDRARDWRALGRRLAAGALVFLVLAAVFSAGIFVGRTAPGLGLAGTATGGPDGTPAPPVFANFWQAWELVDRHYVDQTAVEPTRLTYGAIRGMVDSLGDRGHTRFLTPTEVAAWQTGLAGHFEGIGTYVVLRDDRPTILSPMPGSPAREAGLQNGDVIIQVDGESVAEWTLDQIVSRVRGPAGSTVRLTIQRQGVAHPLEVTVTRRRVTIPSVLATVIPQSTIGHVLITQFTEATTSQLIQALNEVRANGATRLVLDLRNNGGGLRDEAISTAGQFIDDGVVLIEVDAEGNRTPYEVPPDASAVDLPIVVLVNEGTASAGEILAGALQDHRRGPLVGEQTPGYGTVLSTYALADGSAIVLGTAEWLTPDGRRIWHEGIVPNVPVTLPVGATPLTPEQTGELTPAEITAGPDHQLARALELLEPQP